MISQLPIWVLASASFAAQHWALTAAVYAVSAVATLFIAFVLGASYMSGSQRSRVNPVNRLVSLPFAPFMYLLMLNRDRGFLRHPLFSTFLLLLAAVLTPFLPLFVIVFLVGVVVFSLLGGMR